MKCRRDKIPLTTTSRDTIMCHVNKSLKLGLENIMKLSTWD